MSSLNCPHHLLYYCIQSQSANIVSKQLALASVTLVLYDHLLTFSEEVSFFWSGRWTASRMLYLSIRYLSLTQMILVIYGDIKTHRIRDAQVLVIMCYTLAFLVMVLCQCVVAMRVWHLFPRSRIRWLAAVVYIICSLGTAFTCVIKFHAVRDAVFMLHNPLSAMNLKLKATSIFGLYLPSLIIHTILLLLKMYRFHSAPKVLQGQGIFHRFLKEGMFMYAFAAGTLLYEIIGLSTPKPSHMPMFYSALRGEIAVATTVISVCRAMLSIRSLAATYHVDPAWLLNHAELSRVQWKKGAKEGELYVEVNEMDSLSSKFQTSSIAETRSDDDDTYLISDIIP